MRPHRDRRDMPRIRCWRGRYVDTLRTAAPSAHGSADHKSQRTQCIDMSCNCRALSEKESLQYIARTTRGFAGHVYATNRSAECDTSGQPVSPDVPRVCAETRRGK